MNTSSSSLRMLALSAACLAGLPLQAWAGGPAAALVMDYSGKPHPSLMSFSEVAEGDEFALAPTDKLVLLHYRSCKMVTVTGGKVKIDKAKVIVAGGQSAEAPGENCPNEVVIKTAGVGGGVLMRSAPGFAVLPAKLDCVIVGSLRASVSRLQVQEQDAVVLDLPVAGPRVVAPADAPALSPDKDYEMRLLGAKGEVLNTHPVSVEPGAKGACLIRMD